VRSAPWRIKIYDKLSLFGGVEIAGVDNAVVQTNTEDDTTKLFAQLEIFLTIAMKTNSDRYFQTSNITNVKLL